MLKKSKEMPAHGKPPSSAKKSFPVEKEYARCLAALTYTGIPTPLPKKESLGVLGIDGKKYPLPTREQVIELFAYNRELVAKKVTQGFNRLQITPLAVPIPRLIEQMKEAIIKHAAQGKIYQTRFSPSAPFIPVRVNTEKHVWIWDTLYQALDTDRIRYFPEEYSSKHRGQSKLQVINNRRICAIPGWSVGLAESLPLPGPGQGKIVGGRRQLEIGFSPREYLQTLHTEDYRGETGKTLEDFITEFITRLETANEVSNDVRDDNALWCLGQYMKISYAELVPTGRWIRDLGRVRLDMHRTGNKRCTAGWGASTIVRLPGP